MSPKISYQDNTDVYLSKVCHKVLAHFSTDRGDVCLLPKIMGFKQTQGQFMQDVTSMKNSSFANQPVPRQTWLVIKM